MLRLARRGRKSREVLRIVSLQNTIPPAFIPSNAPPALKSASQFHVARNTCVSSCVSSCVSRATHSLASNGRAGVTSVFFGGWFLFGMRLRMAVLHKGVTMGWKSARGLMIVHLALNVVLVCTTFSAYFYVLE